MVKVSVIIPCYNQEDYLEDALNSLSSAQCEFEVVVVNDGSTNECAEAKIKSICEKFTNFRLKLINQSNQGVCVARNNGIKNASGKYILPLDADDKIDSSFLLNAAEILDKHYDVGIVCCNAELFGEKQGTLNLAKPTMINMLSQNRIFNASMFRKADWARVGGYNEEMLEGCEDWDFWLSLLELGLKPYKINQDFYKYRKLPQSRTSQALEYRNYVNIRKKIIKKHKKLYMKYNLLVLVPLFLRILGKKFYGKNKCNNSCV